MQLSVDFTMFTDKALLAATKIYSHASFYKILPFQWDHREYKFIPLRSWKILIPALVLMKQVTQTLVVGLGVTTDLKSITGLPFKQIQLIVRLLINVESIFVIIISFLKRNVLLTFVNQVFVTQRNVKRQGEFILII